MEPEFAYCDKTDTIRVMPGNWLLAYRRDGRWIVDGDMAVPEEMAVLAFRTIHTSHLTRYGSGADFLAALQTG